MDFRSVTRYICHQEPARSFYLNGKPLPLCARCTGFYVGLVIGAISSGLFGVLLNLELEQILILTIIAPIPMALDGFTQLYKYRTSTNNLRFGTGLFCGIILGISTIWLIYSIFS